MKRPSRGAHLPEFALVASVFFLLLFGAVELARMIFTWSTLVEGTRRGARVAAVCPVDHSAIANVAIAGSASGDGPRMHGLTTGQVTVSYLRKDGTQVPDPVASPTDIFFVRVAITGYQHPFIVPFLSSLVGAPTFETTLPSESLGAIPTGQGEAPRAPECYGSGA